MIVRNKVSRSSEAWCGLNKPELNEDDVDVVIFGIPFDEAVSYRQGAQRGPEDLRANTLHSTPFTEEFKSFEDLKVFDAGDFALDPASDHTFEEKRNMLFKSIEDYTCELVKKGKYFNMIGGDHSVTIPVLKGVDKALNSDFGIIHIDAHFDLCDNMDGDKLSHGSVERRSLELDNISSEDNIYFVGIRSIEPKEYQFKKQANLNVFTAKECYKAGIDQVTKSVVNHMRKYKKIYITFDIDALDPAYAAGTGTPQAGGLSSREALILLEGLYKELNIIGMDIVEIAPILDPSLSSMFAGRKLLTESWGHLYEKNNKK